MTENVNPILKKINDLLKEREWSYYKLAQEADLPYSSISSMFQKNTQPTLPTLEKICSGLHISMSEFFSEKPPYREDTFLFSSEELLLINLFRELGTADRKIVMAYLKGFCRKPLN